MKTKLSVIIPCKNEEKYIDKCLLSLFNQNHIEGVKIIIADAKSTDLTHTIINSWEDKLNIQVIDGGLPAIGRNKGALISNTEYILFIDSDSEFYDKDLLIKSVNKMDGYKLDLLGSKLNSKHLLVKLLYKINNLIMSLSKFDKPFSVGMYMMMRRDCFINLGGFPEDVMHCEDYLLSKQVNPKKFGIINKYVYSDDRRFKKMGYLNMIKYIFKNIKNRNNYEYFKKDINYWS